MQYSFDEWHRIILKVDNEWEQAVIWYWINEKERPAGYDSWHKVEDGILKQANDNKRTFWRVRPEENGDLTGGMIFTDGVFEWWDEGYAIQSFVDTLAESGEVTVKYGRSHKHPATLLDAKEYLKEQKFAVAFMGGKAFYTFVLSEYDDNADFTLWDLDQEDPNVIAFFEDLASSGISYRVHNPIILGNPTEFFDTTVEAPYDTTGDLPIYIGDTWVDAIWMKVARDLWYIERDLREALLMLKENLEESERLAKEDLEESTESEE